MGATEAVASAVEQWGKVAEMILQPRTTRALAKAEAESGLVTAKAEIEVATLRTQARRRSELDEIRHYVNLSDTLAAAKEEIEFRGAKALLPEKAGQVTSDPDWFHKWAGYAKETSDQDIRSLWAKVLAGEIIQPGRFSLRLLQAVNLLRKADAEKFARFCNYVWRDVHGGRFLLYDDGSSAWLKSRLSIKNISFDDLAALGLVFARSIVPSLKTEQLDLLCYGGKAYSFLVWKVEGCSPAMIELTELGCQLMDLCEPVPDLEYLAKIAGDAFCGVHPPPSPWPWLGVAPAQ
jgi:hypothetical protein